MLADGGFLVTACNERHDEDLVKLLSLIQAGSLKVHFSDVIEDPEDGSIRILALQQQGGIRSSVA